MFGSKNKVLYFYDDIMGTYQYSTGHPMKPFRVAMTNELVKSYGLLEKLDTYVLTPYRIPIFVVSIFKTPWIRSLRNSIQKITLNS